MIMLTKLNGTQFILNSELIETIYENPDTTIHLINGPIYIVQETLEEVRQRTIDYHKGIYESLLTIGQRMPQGSPLPEEQPQESEE